MSWACQTIELTCSEEASEAASYTQDSQATGEWGERHLQPRISRSRPNALYRYLFTYGRLGHIVIMECVLIHEWMETYLPIVNASYKWTVGQIFPSLVVPRELVDAPLSQTTGFVGVDGSAIRGAKKKSSQMRKEDQKALIQMKKVGDISRARYRFLSESFMRRHGIGVLNERTSDETAATEETGLYASLLSKKGEEICEPESDAEWIVSALTHDDKDTKDLFSSDPAMDSRPGGIAGFEIKGPTRTRKKRAVISDVARLTSEREKKRPKTPRLSDRESGVMGRIRAAGANSLMGRNILGAYPGDVPPPSEAADSQGLFDLAERYGFGDWSDSDEDLAENNRPEMRSRLVDGDEFKKETERKKKRHRKSPQEVKVDFGIGFGTKSSSSSTPRISRTRVRAKRSDKIIQPSPMERIREVQKQNPIMKETGSVGKAGLDAFEKSVERRRRKEPKSMKKDVTMNSMAKMEQAKSQIGQSGSIIAKTGLEYLKEKKERTQRTDNSQ